MFFTLPSRIFHLTAILYSCKKVYCATKINLYDCLHVFAFSELEHIIHNNYACIDGAQGIMLVTFQSVYYH